MKTILHRFAWLAAVTLSTGLVGCAASDDGLDDEPTAGSSEELNSAGIVPQVSIRGVKLGMTESQVRSLLGKPDSTEHWGTRDAASLEYGKTRVQLGDDGRVVIVDTLSQGVRTKENVGINSLRLNVEALPNMQCSTRKEDVDGEDVYRHQCAISSAAAITFFFFPPTDTPEFGANAKVSRVQLWKR
jgi:hypothetical protein